MTADMFLPRPLLALCFMFVCFVGGLGDVPTREQAEKLLAKGRTEQAIEALVQITDAQPAAGWAWFQLAGAHHSLGDYEAAAAAWRRAAAFSEQRPSALYNVACAEALLGRADQAAAALDQSLAAGFLDFDLMGVDTDLALLRDAGRIPMPEAHGYETLRHGSVVMPYRVLLPESYDPEQTYPAAVVFAPGGMGKRSTDWTLDTLWADPQSRAGWILVCAAQPDNGWINHPSHHALNALMKHVRKEHRVLDDRFHFIGLGEGGRPAATYASMSRTYVSGLTLVDSRAYARWDDEEVAELAGEHLPMTLIAASGDEAVIAEARRVVHLIGAAGGEVSLVPLEGDRPALLRRDATLLLPRSPSGTP